MEGLCWREIGLFPQLKTFLDCRSTSKNPKKNHLTLAHLYFMISGNTGKEVIQ